MLLTTIFERVLPLLSISQSVFFFFSVHLRESLPAATGPQYVHGAKGHQPFWPARHAIVP